MIATAIIAPMNSTSITMEIKAKKDTPAVQQVMRPHTSVYAMVIAPMETEATFLVPKSRRAENPELDVSDVDSEKRGGMGTYSQRLRL